MERLQNIDWNNAGQMSGYPFADTADLRAAQVQLTEVFRDGVVYSARYLSTIDVQAEQIVLTLDDGSTATFVRGSAVSSLRFENYGRDRGVLVLADGGVNIMNSWPVGTYDVDVEFCASARTPEVAGLTHIAADGQQFSGIVNIVGEQGIKFTWENSKLIIHACGDPGMRQRYCGEAYDSSGCLRTINGMSGSDSGDFQLLPSDRQALDTPLRIAGDGNRVVVTMTGA